MRLRTGNNRRKLKNPPKHFEVFAHLPDYTEDFGRGYFFRYYTYRHDSYERLYQLQLRRWTPKCSKTYYSTSLRYAGWVVMDHTKYYRRLFRQRNPLRWKAYYR